MWQMSKTLTIRLTKAQEAWLEQIAMTTGLSAWFESAKLEGKVQSALK
jgi:hypothetical protein